MTILLNTAIDPGTVAVRDGAWRWERFPLGRGAAFPGTVLEGLASRDALARAATIVVVNGPGSSTGLRIGCAYANALATVSGAELRACSSYEFVRLLHPARPELVAFRQGEARVTVATRVDGAWTAADAASPPPGAWLYDAAALVVDERALDAVRDASTAVDVMTPRYWAPPMISIRR